MISALFPFDPTLDAVTAALYGEGSMLGPLAHLAGLTAVYGAFARAAVSRLA